jgi:hypothetical protein
MKFKVDTSGFKLDVDAIKKATFNSVSKAIADKVKAARCPEHGQTPRVEIKGTSTDNMSWEVFGCCEKIVSEVKATLKG